jgi:small-conductance mechanosensitive channel
VANVIAGVIQTYTGAFRVGDVIKIGEVSGIVVEKRLLSTEVRTFKNEEVFIPNAAVISSNVMNYSKMARGKGVIFYTTVTIGYDAPWRKIHELLVTAAVETPDIQADPAPFVLQTSLNDYHVSYQLNCYTRRPDRMMKIYSALHASIQDHFNAAGVEIMSPTFSALRDGNTVTIPPEQRPEGYQPPGFRIEPPAD